MPFCPNCRTEYESGCQRCDACDCDLVNFLSSESEPEDTGELVELAEFHTVSEAEMIREILEENGIQTVQRGEVDPIGIASGAEPVSLLVDEKQYPKARQLYDAYFAGNDTEETPGEE